MYVIFVQSPTKEYSQVMHVFLSVETELLEEKAVYVPCTDPTKE